MRREMYINAFIFKYPDRLQVEDLYTRQVYGQALEFPGELFAVYPVQGLDGERLVQALTGNGYDAFRVQS